MRIIKAHHQEHIARITNLPASASGMRIGLFGGSFNPPHAGHRLVSRQVMKRLNLDAIWWLVSPGNPLKNHAELAPLKERVEQARSLITLPNVYATGFEAAHGFTYSFDSLLFLKKTLKDRKFIWIMGSDNLKNFHKWERWRSIADLMPMAIYARPNSAINATFSKAAINLAKYRINEDDAALLPFMPAPAWVYLHGIMSQESSSAIRNKNY